MPQSNVIKSALEKSLFWLDKNIVPDSVIDEINQALKLVDGFTPVVTETNEDEIPF